MSEERKTPVLVWIVGGIGVGIVAVAAVAIIWFAIRLSQSTTVIEEDEPGHMRVKMTVGDKKK